MKKMSGSWLILGGMLVVPAVLFWNWSKGMNTKTEFGKKSSRPFGGFGKSAPPAPAPREAESSSPAAPMTVNQFNSARPAAAPVQPGQITAAHPAAAPLPIAPGATARAAAPPITMNPEANSNGTTAPASGALPGMRAGNAPQAALPAVSSGTRVEEFAFKPKSDRDPMLSPREILLLKERENPVVVTPTKPMRPVRRAPPSPEKRVRVSGIVQVGARAFTAIINDQIHKVGDTVGGCKVVKITDSTVTFQFKGKKFSKVVPK